MKSRLVDPIKFHKDLDNFYLSDYLVRELREYYTIQELSTYYNSRNQELKPRDVCKKNWPICYLALEKCKSHQNSHVQLFTTQYILSNFKFNHFLEKRTKPLPSEENAEAPGLQKIDDKDLLIERQRHSCECKDHDLERMKSEIRDRISKMLANPSYSKSMQLKNQMAKKPSSEVNQLYSEFMKNHKNTLTIPEEQSDYSQSVGSKPSHELTHYNNTCKRD